MNRNLMNSYAAFLLGCLWTALAIGMFFVREDNILAIFTDQRDYKSTSGVIISSKVIYKGSKNAGWHFEIIYQYTVNGEEYISNNVNFASTGLTSSDEYAKAYVEKYPIGMIIRVYYDPNTPSKAVIEPENKSFTDFFIVVILLVLAIIFFAISIKIFSLKETKTEIARLRKPI